MKLLHNSIEIKTENLTDPIAKLKAVITIQLKVIMKYDEFITILLSQIWGTEPRHQHFRKYIYEYIDVIQKIIEEGIEKGVIRDCDSHLMASSVFGAICSAKIYKLEKEQDMDIALVVNSILEYMIKGMHK